MAEIKTIEQLRAKMGEPHKLTQQKIYDHLFVEARDFIAKSPLLFLATCNKDGMPTVSPKGDGPGFVEIMDDARLLIPDRPGNKLLHGMSNIIDTGVVGLIFLIPGMEETLRINGQCTIRDDEDLCARLEARNRPAELVLDVKVETCFFHCAKAFKRSQTWDPDSWGEPVSLSFGDIIARNAGNNRATKYAIKKAVDVGVSVDYKKNI